MSSPQNHGAGDASDTAVSRKASSAVSLGGHAKQIFSHVKVGNLVAGLSGGVVSTLVLHPLDLVKIRFAGTLIHVECVWLLSLLNHCKTCCLCCHAPFPCVIKRCACLYYTVSDGLELRPKYRGLVHCMKSVWAEEGLRGLYQGVTPNVWGAGASWGLYFLL